MRREHNEGFREGFRGGGPRQSFAPVKVGEEVEVTIEGVGEKGDGIAKINRFVIFVPGAKQGETVKVRITKVFRKVGFAEVIGSEGSSEAKEESAEETVEESQEETTEEETQENVEEV